MRTLRFFIFSTITALIASSASAQLVIYKGSLKQTAIGKGASAKLTSKFDLIVDHATGFAAEIQYVAVKGSKLYSTGTETNLHIVQFDAAHGKTYEALSQPPNSCDLDEGNTNDIVFVQGADSELKVDTNTTITFPKTLSGGDTEIDSSSGSPISVTTVGVVSFDPVQTGISNGNGETMDAAVARISAILEGEGYVKQTGLSRKSGRALLSLLPVNQ
ncbi:MAG TPA: hypothetical protein VKV04_11615 [Verrucomicrobiae bacterium]|nr:hypothetical protein [Verrucomicrobiae bacterium]